MRYGVFEESLTYAQKEVRQFLALLGMMALDVMIIMCCNIFSF